MYKDYINWDSYSCGLLSEGDSVVFTPKDSEKIANVDSKRHVFLQMNDMVKATVVEPKPTGDIVRVRINLLEGINGTVYKEYLIKSEQIQMAKLKFVMS